MLLKNKIFGKSHCNEDLNAGHPEMGGFSIQIPTQYYIQRWVVIMYYEVE